MPQPAFFRSLGLFVDDHFLAAPVCERMKQAVLASPAKKGAVVDHAGETHAESERRVLCAGVDSPTMRTATELFQRLQPRLQDHFHVALSGFERPIFLRYGEGAYYKAHRDVTADMPADYQSRRISAVVFLNAAGDQSRDECYGGGALAFYGLMEGAQWEKCAFDLDVNPGLLVAFPSHTPHEVRPVTFGERFTIVTWYNA
jgi:SM-20-related protein